MILMLFLTQSSQRGISLQSLEEMNWECSVMGLRMQWKEGKQINVMIISPRRCGKTISRSLHVVG